MDIFIIFMNAHKSHFLIFMGVFLFIVINIIGRFMLSDFELSGYYQPLGEVIREKLLSRYDKLAWIALLGFFILAFKAFMKDWRKYTAP
ncbi:hypothetical protein [Marinicellulosiphila megalodicopiae]|uniref:hypothetical protein n=1 Tax=Marinicellulosiphila megalodicopiae TaxID=2724896 RepID=UPI003BAED53A